jgi:hypothetical protein
MSFEGADRAVIVLIVDRKVTESLLAGGALLFWLFESSCAVF